MKFSISILAGLLSISSTAVGDIVAITLPKRLSVDEDFTGYLNSVGNSSKTASLAVVFGAAPIKYAREKMLGTAILGKKTLDSRILRVSDHDYNISVPLTVPANFPKGETVVTAALYSRVGGRSLPITVYFNVTVNVTDDKDDDDDDEHDEDDDDDDDDDMDDIEYVRSSGFLTNEKNK